MPGDESRIIKGRDTATGRVQIVGMTDGRLLVEAAGTETPIATPTTYNITCTVLNTEYSQAFPANCRYFEFQARTEAIIRYAFETGRVAAPIAPYHTLKAGDYYFSPQLNQGASPSTLYVASPTAGTVVELLVWI